MLYHIGPARAAHGYFPVAHQKNIYEGLLAAGENEVVTICRNSWAGSQRYGAAPAAHDIMSSFEHLEEYMKAGLNLAMSGIPWGASEIGGFVTHDNQSDRFHELMVRWYQYGVFTPVFRTHGHRKNNEAWTIGGDAYRHMRAAIFLRERLRPYVMQQMKLASQQGLPPMRPLFFDFADDPETAAVEDQFLFGPDLLVAPITRYQARSREVYLPAGTDWSDAWTGTRLAGGQRIVADAPLEHIPVYVRGDKRGPGRALPGFIRTLGGSDARNLPTRNCGSPFLTRAACWQSRITWLPKPMTLPQMPLPLETDRGLLSNRETEPARVTQTQDSLVFSFEFDRSAPGADLPARPREWLFPAQPEDQQPDAAPPAEADAGADPLQQARGQKSSIT